VSERILGQFSGVRVVDVTNLEVTVYIYYSERPSTGPLVTGSFLGVRRVKVQATPLEGGGTRLTLANDGSIRVHNTGPASAGPGGIAVSGVSGQVRGRVRVSRTGSATAGPGGRAVSGVSMERSRPREHVVIPGRSFRQEVPSSGVTVEMFVDRGTRVLY
jgi:hypothetical protein